MVNLQQLVVFSVIAGGFDAKVFRKDLLSRQSAPLRIYRGRKLS